MRSPHHNLVNGIAMAALALATACGSTVQLSSTRLGVSPGDGLTSTDGSQPGGQVSGGVPTGGLGGASGGIGGSRDSAGPGASGSPAPGGTTGATSGATVSTGTPTPRGQVKIGILLTKVGQADALG